MDLKKELQRIIDANSAGDISDGYHTFNELYRYRLLYNACFFNMLSKYTSIRVTKSRRHSDGEFCFGGNYFIVVAELPEGQVSNHYELRYWDLFQCEEVDKSPVWDGHTPEEAADRMEEFCANSFFLEEMSIRSCL